MTQWGYQKDGADFLTVSRYSRLLADEPGLGKTRQSILAMDAIKAKRVLIVCPAVARPVWVHEIEKWSKKNRHVFIWNTPAVPKAAGDTNIAMIVSYNAFSNDADKVRILNKLDPWDVIIFDEAHYLKGPSKRSRAAYGRKFDGVGGLISNTPRVWLLTGTPAPNHIGEMYNHCRALLPDKFMHNGQPMSRFQFEDTFCIVRTTVYGRSIAGSKNQHDFRNRIDDWMLRRRKKDVLSQLPPLRFEMTPLDFDKVPELVSREIDEIAKTVRDLIGKGPANDDDILNALKASKMALATHRRALGILKVPAVLAWAREFLEGSKEKLILFAHHQEVIDKLMEGLLDYMPVKIDGRDTPIVRKASIQNFMRDARCRVFVGQITAAGTAITLTSASTVAFPETSWVPNDNFQAACRAHRIGQQDGVVAHFLYVPGTLDTQILTAVKRKTEELAQVFD